MKSTPSAETGSNDTVRKQRLLATRNADEGSERVQLCQGQVLQRILFTSLM